MMKSIVLTILMFLLATAAYAQFSKGGVHNFTDGIGNDSWFSGDISCSACHTQHGASSPSESPSWDPEFGASFLPAYNSDSIAMKSAGMDGTTKLCMSCHDGSIGTEIDYDPENGHNHPMGNIYDSRISETLVPPESLALPLSEGRVGCISCHDPHGDNYKLLRMDNYKSKLCFHCHAL